MKLSANKCGMLIFTFAVCSAAYAFPVMQPASASAPQAAATTTPPPESYINMAAPNVSCIITGQPTQDGTAPQAQDRFTVKTPAFYFVCSSDNAVPVQKLTGVWIAVNTRGMMPNNTVLSKKDNKPTEAASVNKPWIATFQATMPSKGWPVGEYRVDLYYSNQLIDSQGLTVTFNTNAW